MVDQTEVSVELQAVLNHLAGPMPNTPIDGLLDSKIEEKYTRVTWYNSVMYAQDKAGTWSRVYLNIDNPVLIDTGKNSEE